MKLVVKFVFILIVLAAAGHYLWIKTSYLDFVKPKLLNLVGIKDETVDWKIYRSKMGFTIKYPPSWFVIATEPQDNHFVAFDFTLNKNGAQVCDDMGCILPGVHIGRGQEISVEDFVEGIQPPTQRIVGQPQEVYIGGNKFTKILTEQTPSPGTKSYNLLLEYGHYMFNFSAEDIDTDYLTFLEKMLTTLKVNRELAKDNWVEYRSDKLGLEFNYPSRWGKVIESHHDLSQYPSIRPEINPKGQELILSFSEDDTVYSGFPVITAVSQDYVGDGNYVYKGEVSSGEAYQQADIYKTKPKYLDLVGFSDKAVTFVDTNYPDKYDYKPMTVNLYAKIPGGVFNGLNVTRQLVPYAYYDWTDQNSRSLKHQEFIKKIENKTVDQRIKRKIDEFNSFVATLKLVK